jgi:hypothetical protein
MAASELSAGAIHRRLELEANSGEADFGPADVPSQRTIHNIVREHTPRDDTDPWALADAEADEAALILPVLAAIIEKTEERRSYLTQAQARWIVRIRRAAPDLNAWMVYLIALNYMALAEHGLPHNRLDAYLAFAPWRSQENRWRYNKATEKDPARWDDSFALTGGR